MSGGVDSSVAAALMLERGHEVIGATLKQWEGPDGSLPTTGCCTLADAEDARRVAAILGIRHYVLDYTDEFNDLVVAPFGEAYLAGLTPNPCIECNRRVRFRALLDRAAELECDILVTGHHARIEEAQGGRFRLLRAVDRSKDQSYVLHMLGQDQLGRIRFPVGEMTKADVRAEAARLGLRVAAKADSQDLCFVAGDYRSFLRGRFPDSDRPGPIEDGAGRVVGAHRGTADFTIGQRRGLGVAAGEPRYVIDVRPTTATVVIGTRDDLLVDGFGVADVSFVAGGPPEPGTVEVKVRYREEPAPARLEQTAQGWNVRFPEPRTAAAPGQAAVFYRGDEVLGGGTITASLRR
jgi:tRNA-specific 2-thiouridylase